MNTYIKNEQETLEQKLGEVDLHRFHGVGVTTREYNPEDPPEHDSLCLWRAPRTLTEGIDDGQSHSRQHEDHLWIVVSDLGDRQQLDFVMTHLRKRLEALGLPAPAEQTLSHPGHASGERPPGDI